MKTNTPNHSTTRQLVTTRRARQLLTLSILLTSSTTVLGQNSSLFHQPAPMNMTAQAGNRSAPPEVQQPIRGLIPTVGVVRATDHPLQSSSWTYVPSQPARTLKIHDLITIRVDEMSTTSAQGNASSRKNTIYDARLQDWIRFDGLGMKPAPQADGDPRVQGQQNEVYRADSTIRTRESMTFNIAAEIADIRPNGTLVLSAHKTLEESDNVFDIALSGICRAEDIQPDGTILSKNIHELQVKKDARGHVRDGYSRGWFTRLVARIKPF